MSTSVIDQETPSSEKEDVVERFRKERETWTDEIKEISKKFKDVEEMFEVQIELYSKRQIAVEYIHKLATLQSKMKKKHSDEWRKAYDSLMLDHDYRYTEREKNKAADDKTAGSKLRIEILQTHIDFFRDTVKTIDNMIFGVKHRLEIEDFRRGNK